MENRINVAELLRDCPKGMELNCTMYKNVEFDRVDENNGLYPIICRTKTTNGSYKIHTFTKYGCYNTEMYSKCVIFPKGKTTWEGFHRPFEPCDIVITDNNEHAFIYSGENDNFWECYCGVYCGTRTICINSRVWSDKKHNIRLATEKEKEELFQVIKDNGYNWNSNTKSLEKITQLNFKDGDVVYIKTRVFEHIFIFKVSKDDRFIESYATLSDNSLYLNGYPICETKDVKEIRLATEEERRKFFDAIKAKSYKWNNEIKTLKKLVQPIFKAGNKVRNKNNHNIVFTITSLEEDYYVCGAVKAFWFDDQDKYELVPDKFDIITLKPFESKVLVRDKNTDEWRGHFFSHYNNNSDKPYICIGLEGINEYKQCIPYEENEYLLGKTDDCSDYYKTWINEENKFD